MAKRLRNCETQEAMKRSRNAALLTIRFIKPPTKAAFFMHLVHPTHRPASARIGGQIAFSHLPPAVVHYGAWKRTRTRRRNSRALPPQRRSRQPCGVWRLFSRRLCGAPSMSRCSLSSLVCTTRERPTTVCLSDGGGQVSWANGSCSAVSRWLPFASVAGALPNYSARR
jgi:hypothetical protein